MQTFFAPDGVDVAWVEQPARCPACPLLSCVGVGSKDGLFYLVLELPWARFYLGPTQELVNRRGLLACVALRNGPTRLDADAATRVLMWIQGCWDAVLDLAGEQLLDELDEALL